jgi:Fe-S cluster biosynthesis and repair protein YggX
MMGRMAKVDCRRCGHTKSGLAQAPLRGKWGPLVLADTCAECWHDWVEEQTRLINHERLLPAEPEHRKLLYQKMAAFLKLESA